MPTPPLTGSEIARRKRGVAELLTGTKFSKKHLFRVVTSNSVTPEAAEKRVELMRKAGVPPERFLTMLGYDRPTFERILERHRTGMTPRGREVFDFLIKEHVSEEIALGIARHRRRPVFLKDVQAKVAYLKDYELNPAQYGTSRLPVSVWQELLRLELSELKKGIKKTLKKLEDAHSEKLLDVEFPGWRNKPALVNRASPTEILNRVRVSEKAGVKNPTVKFLAQNSAGAILKQRGRSKYVERLEKRFGADYIVPTKFGAKYIRPRLERMRQRLTHIEAIFGSKERIKNGDRLFDEMNHLRTNIAPLASYLNGTLPVNGLEAVLNQMTRRKKR